MADFKAWSHSVRKTNWFALLFTFSMALFHVRYSNYLKSLKLVLEALAASLRVGFCDEWKRGFTLMCQLLQSYQPRTQGLLCFREIHRDLGDHTYQNLLYLVFLKKYALLIFVVSSERIIVCKLNIFDRKLPVSD